MNDEQNNLRKKQEQKFAKNLLISSLQMFLKFTLKSSLFDKKFSNKEIIEKSKKN